MYLTYWAKKVMEYNILSLYHKNKDRQEKRRIEKEEEIL